MKVSTACLQKLAVIMHCHPQLQAIVPYHSTQVFNSHVVMDKRNEAAGPTTILVICSLPITESRKVGSMTGTAEQLSEDSEFLPFSVCIIWLVYNNDLG